MRERRDVLFGGLLEVPIGGRNMVLRPDVAGDSGILEEREAKRRREVVGFCWAVVLFIG